eukprot:5226946-Pyramimonas_sp.AAC.1
MPDPSVETYTEWTAQGVRKWSGGKDLKGTQAYPELFGENIQHLYDLHRESIRGWASAVSDLSRRKMLTEKDWVGGDNWDDADLAPVFRYLLQL